MRHHPRGGAPSCPRWSPSPRAPVFCPIPRVAHPAGEGVTSPPTEWGWGLGAPPALLMARGQTFASWYSQNQAGSVPGLLGLELRKVAGLPAPRAHDNMPGGAWGPAWGGRALPSQAAGFRGLLVSPFSSPSRRQGTKPGRGAPPAVRLNWGEHACAQHPGASFGWTVSRHWWPTERRLQRRLWGVGGGQQGFTFGRAGGRDRAERIGTAPGL